MDCGYWRIREKEVQACLSLLFRFMFIDHVFHVMGFSVDSVMYFMLCEVSRLFVCYVLIASLSHYLVISSVLLLVTCLAVPFCHWLFVM